VRDIWFIWDIEHGAYWEQSLPHKYTTDYLEALWYTFNQAMLTCSNNATLKEQWVSCIPVHIDAAEHGFASPHHEPA